MAGAHTEREANDDASVDETATLAVSADHIEPLSAGPPTAGRYVLIERIGIGGMGTVWRAYDPKLRREVALKQLRPDALARDATARLVREAQAMAQLSHPHVVAVYDVELGQGKGDGDGDDDDADGDESGGDGNDDASPLPSEVLIAMEYVPGANLRGWLREETRAWTDRLALLRQAGRGLAAAHAVGLVHRDFKPGNVLVTGSASTGWIAKVTDFGLAKGVDAPDAERPLTQPPLPRPTTGPHDTADSLSAPLTELETVIGTPRYMAPEQHAGLAAGPQADQYAFCVAAWEALTGEPPFSGRKLADAKGEGPPRWPDATGVPSRIVDAIRRGLAPDPAHRWASLEELLARLEHDPRSGLRRYAYVGALGLLLVAGGLAAKSLGTETETPCQNGAAELSEAWDDSSADAIRDAFARTKLVYAQDTAARVVGPLEDYATAWIAQHRDSCEATAIQRTQSDAVLDLRMACLYRARAALAATAQRLRGADAKTVEKAVSLVQDMPALARCEDVDALRQAVPPPEDPDTASAVEEERARLTQSRTLRRTHDFDGALDIAAEASARADALGYPPFVAEARLELGHVQVAKGRYADAETALREAFELSLQQDNVPLARQAGTALLRLVGHTLTRPEEATWLGPVALSLARSQREGPLAESAARAAIGAVLQSKGEYEAARAELETALDIRVTHSGEQSLGTATLVHSLGVNATARGEFEEAESLLRRALEIRKTALGADHPAIAVTLTAIGDVLRHQGRPDEALEILRQSLEQRRRVLGPNHPEVANCLNNIGITLYTKGDYEGAAKANEEALAVRVAAFGPEDANVADSYNNIGASYAALGRYEEAEAQHRAALDIRVATVGESHPDVAMSLTNLAIATRHQGKLDEAEGHARRALEVNEARLGRDHAEVANMHDNLGAVLLDKEEHQAALAEFTRGMEIRVDKLGEGHPQVARSLTNRGSVLLELERLDEAQVEQRKAIEIWERELGPDYADLAHAYVGIYEVMKARGRNEDALVALERAADIRTKAFGPDNDTVRETLAALEELRAAMR